MKNTTDLSENGTRWTTHLTADSIPGGATRWGATEVYKVPHNEIGMSGRGPTFMVKLEDGWHYAHGDGRSAYCAAEAFDAKTGREAWLTNVLRMATDALESAQRTLREAIGFKGMVEAERAREIHSQGKAAK